MTRDAKSNGSSGCKQLDRRSESPTGGVLKRVMLIGLDGATFDVLDPLMQEGRMPNLAKLCKTGTRGILQSTKPPITPAAWTTFMTGKGPGRHGIIDFLRYDMRSGKLSFNNYIEIAGKTIWELLSEHGLRVGSINVPMTFPPRKVNGFMISGFDTPGVDQDFTYPRDLKAEILKRYPDYTHEKKWMRKVFGGDKLFQENLAYISQSFERGFELASFCGNKYGWDVLMVLYKFVDNLQHKVWKYIDPETAPLYPRRNEMVKKCFADLDVSIGKLMALAAENEASIMIMSDHGHGSLLGKAQPNLLLQQWGYLKLGETSSRASIRAKHLLRRFSGRRNVFTDQGGQAIDRELAVDWSQTRACVIHAGIYGFCYLNVRGRQPGGIVDPSEYESLRDEIAQRFVSARTRTPKGKEIPIFTEALKPEELYNCTREEQPWMPDLLLVPTDSLAVMRKIRGNKPVKWLPLRRIEGTHRLAGVFVAQGEGFRSGHTLNASIADLAPTLLAGLGLPVPQDMEGTVLRDAFDGSVTVEYEPPAERDVSDDERIALTEAQEAEVADRLSDLGYLE